MTMISRYNTFLGERLFESAISESMIYYTKEFKDALSKLSLKSKIAKDLIEVEYTDVKPDMTFIGMSDKEGYFSFTQIKKAVNAIKKAAEILAAENEDSWSFDFKSRITDIWKGIEDGTTSQSNVNYLYNSEPWNLKDKARSDAKIAKLVNQIFPDKYSNKEIEEFTNMFKKVEESSDEFEIVYGTDILHWYSESNYSESKGELGTSCMRYNRCRDYLKIYSENPEVCRLLILKTEDGQKIKGRALVWKIKEIRPKSKTTNEEGDLLKGVEYYMDRIYAIDDATKQMFQEHADEQGWLKRLTSSYGDCQDFKLGEQAYKRIFATVQLKKWEFEEYPYMDTFKRLDTDSGILINDDNQDEEGYYVMTETNGQYTDTSGKWSDYFDERIPENEAMYSDALRDWIWRDTAREVEIGRHQGWYPEVYEEVIRDCVTGRWLHENDAIYSDQYDDYFLAEDAIEVITNIGSDSSLDYLDSSYGTMSDNDDNIVWYSQLECSDYLSLHGAEEYIVKDILEISDETGKYYFDYLNVKAYKTEKGSFIKEDCIALGLNPDEKKSYYTDSISYNFKMDKETKKNLYKALREKASELKSIVSGKQTELQFDKEEQKEYIKAKSKLLESINVRIYEFDKWVE